MCGWRRELTLWEYPEMPLSKPEDAHFPGNYLTFGTPFQAGEEFLIAEIEVVLEGAHQESIAELLSHFLSPVEIEALFFSCKSIGLEPISANRDLVLPDELEFGGWKAVDFSVSTLPSRRGDGSAPLYYGCRWGRVFRRDQLILTVYSETVSGYWTQKEIRWPHFSVPSFPEEWFTTAPSLNLPEEFYGAIISDLMSNVLKHNLHFLRSWTLESELWEQEVFRRLIEPEPSSLDSGFHEIESELGRLADFLSQLRTGFRNLHRRAEVSRLLKSVPGLSDQVRAQTESAEAQLDSDRTYLRSHLETMRALSDKVQTLNAEEQIRLSQKSEKLINRVVALLLIPSFVVAVYGANVRELSTEGTRGSLLHLALWLTVTIIVSFSVLGIVEGREFLPRKIVSRVVIYAFALSATWILVWTVGLSAPEFLALGVVATLMILIGELRVVYLDRRARPQTAATPAHKGDEND